jgi:hypothetical protein
MTGVVAQRVRWPEAPLTAQGAPPAESRCSRSTGIHVMPISVATGRQSEGDPDCGTTLPLSRSPSRERRQLSLERARAASADHQVPDRCTERDRGGCEVHGDCQRAPVCDRSSSASRTRRAAPALRPERSGKGCSVLMPDRPSSCLAIRSPSCYRQSSARCSLLP